MSEQTARPASEPSKSTMPGALALWIIKRQFGIPILLVVFLAALVGSAYVCWWLLLPNVLAWANEAGWRWILAWFAVIILGFGPMYVVMGVGPIILAALSAVGERSEKKELDDLDILEAEIRGSDDRWTMQGTAERRCALITSWDKIKLASASMWEWRR